MNNDKAIKDLLDKVEAQEKDLGTKPKIAYNSNAQFSYKDGMKLNLNTVNTSDPLVEALAYLLDRKKVTTEAAKRLGVESSTFKWDGFSVSQWEEDFKQRLELINYDAKAKHLAATKKKLKELTSEEGRTADALDEIAKSLSV